MSKEEGRSKEQLVFSRREQRAIVIEALGIMPKCIGVSYGAIWNIAKAEGITLIRR